MPGLATIYHMLIRGSYTRFFITGATGALLNIAVTWILAEFVFGRPQYFYAYTIGMVVNIMYNFILHTFLTFKTTGGHTRRFIVFFLYSVLVTYIQAITVKWLVPIVGLQYYVIVIAGVIFFYSTINFFIFKAKIFKS